MKKTLYSILFSTFLLSASAQFTYQWANSAGSSGAEYGEAVATDANGNVYTTGSFTGTTDFSTGAPAMVLTSKGGSDVFLTKHAPNGNTLFAFQLGGSDDEYPYDVYVNASGVYVVGKFKGTCDFDPSANAATLTYSGGGTDGDGFVAKYDLAGNYQWAFKLGGIGNDRVLGITGDAAGDIVVSGFFSNTVDFNPGAATVNLTSTVYNAFFAKYSSTGTYVFAKQLVGNYSEANDVQLDASGNIYIAGGFSETVDFDPSGSTAAMSTSGVTQIDAYFAKYSSTGIYAWAKRIGGSAIDYINQIAISATNIYVGGIFSTTCDVDPATPVVNIISAGASDLFFAKYDLNGLYQFAYGIGGTQNDYLNGLALGANDNIFITGKFLGTTINFSQGGTGVLTGANTGYIAQYTSSGNFVAAHTIGNGTSEGKGIYVNATSVYYTGSFQGTVDFNFSSTVTANLTSVGADDVFVSKLNHSSSTAIEAIENKNIPLVYPNPSNGIFSLKSEKGKIEVYNSLGQILYQLQKQTDDILSIDLSNQPAGIYFMMMNVDDKIVQQKIIIQ